MSGKAFLGLLVAVIVLGGAFGGAFIGGYKTGENKGKSQAEATAAAQTSQGLDSLRQQLQSQFGQGGQSLSGTPRPGIFGTPGPGGALRGEVGTIEKIENGRLTLSTTRGTLEATVSSDTTIEKTSVGSLSDLKAGMQVTVAGQRDSSTGVLKASTITIVPEGGVFGFGAFGGRGGLGTPQPTTTR